MLLRKLVIAAVFSAAAILSGRLDAAGGSVLIRNARVFDGEKSIGVRDVLVVQGLITTVGKRLKAPTDVETVDGTGKTLIPGLIDSHVHVFPSTAEDALRFGVTVEFDMFTIATPEMVARRRASRSSLNRTDAADVWSAGNGITPPGGHPTAIAKRGGVDIPTLADDADAGTFVKTQVAEGADYIKIFQEGGFPSKPLPRFSKDRLRELIRFSHDNGRKAIVHVSKLDDARDAFSLGADATAHIWDDQAADDSTVNLIKSRGGVVIATLSVLAGISDDPAPKELAADPAIAPYLSPIQRGMLAARYPKKPEVLDRALASVRRLHDAKVTILVGTDASNPATAHGASVHEELELLVRAGMTASEALSAATVKPAAFFGTNDRGRIAKGLRADLVLVEGDPTTDIKATRKIVGIWKNGYPVDRSKVPSMPPVPGAK